MIKFNASEWQNLEALDADSLLDEIRIEAEVAMKAALLMFEGEVKRTLSGKRSGRTYKVSKTGRLHVASAPGEPPARLYGNLVNSVGHSGPEWDGYTVQGEVGPGLGQAPADGSPDPSTAYARRMELGGIDSRGINILPRPYMEPTAMRVEPKIEQLFRSAVGSP